MIAAIQFKFPSYSLPFTRAKRAHGQGDSLRVVAALAEKQGLRKEIAGYAT
jgi:hypothetical protein